MAPPKEIQTNPPISDSHEERLLSEDEIFTNPIDFWNDDW